MVIPVMISEKPVTVMISATVGTSAAAPHQPGALAGLAGPDKGGGASSHAARSVPVSSWMSLRKTRLAGLRAGK
jgi:hypothetical protein